MWYANTILGQMLATEIGTNKIPYTAADQPNEKAAKIVSHFTGGINGHEKKGSLIMKSQRIVFQEIILTDCEL